MYKIRAVEKKDLQVVLDLITELAIYEKAPQEVTLTIHELENDSFGDNKMIDIIVAESENGVIDGMALFFTAYSSWKGRCLYLEDIIVRENMRGKGIGKLLFEEVIAIAKQRKSKRMMWQVLAWNRPAIDFYKKYNAELSDEWLNGRFHEIQLNEL